MSSLGGISLCKQHCLFDWRKMFLLIERYETKEVFPKLVHQVTDSMGKSQEALKEELESNIDARKKNEPHVQYLSIFSVFIIFEHSHVKSFRS